MHVAQKIVVHVAGGTDWSTLVVAVLGVVLSLAALAWQAWSFFATGSRVKVKVRRGLLGSGAVVSFPNDDVAEGDLKLAAEQGFTHPIYVVHVSNTGRGPTSITNVELVFSDEGALQTTTPDPELPHKLEGEHDVSWRFEASHVSAYAKTSRQVWPEKTKNLVVRGRVTLGSDRKVTSKNALSV